MIEVAIVGAGQLGSRHLQALAQLDRPATITVIDPQAAALELARERFGQVATNGFVKEVLYAADMSALSKRVDVAVVATPANIRLPVVSQLLATSDVSYLVLEKVLVQSSADLDALNKVVGDTATWVNCPRRMFGFYQQLREQLNGGAPIDITVRGGNWGMACNAVHFIDLAVFLSSSSVNAIDATGLDPIVRDSKRAGFKELSGTLRAKLNNGSRIELSAQFDSKEPLIMDLSCRDGSLSVKIDEGAKRASVLVGAIGGQGGELAIDVRFQSVLTQEVVQSLTSAGSCSLTPLSESAALHRPFLDALLGVFKRLEPEAGHSRVPIT